MSQRHFVYSALMTTTLKWSSEIRIDYTLCEKLRYESGWQDKKIGIVMTLGKICQIFHPGECGANALVLV
jgi:hypothetical protein